MRPVLVALLCSVACGSCARRAPSDGPPAERTVATRPATELEPAPTPGEAFERATRALAEGDAAAYRRIVVFRPPSRLLEATTRLKFASTQLHRAVREHKVEKEHVRDGLSALPYVPPEQLEQALAHYRQIEWNIEGDVATPATTRPLTDPSQKLWVERSGDGWVVAMSDGIDTRDGDDVNYRHFIQSRSMSAEIIGAAAREVESGKLRTYRQVSDFIEAQRDAIAKRALVEIMAGQPRGPVVVVTDDETGRPVAGAKVWGKCILPPGRYKSLKAVTDKNGRAHLPAQPETVHAISVEADGYARQHRLLHAKNSEPGALEEVHLEIGKPAIVEVMLVLPDDRRAFLNVYEGSEDNPAPPGLREDLEPKRLRIPVQWEDPPPDLPEHNPMLRLHLPSASPHKGKEGVVHRVVAAQVAPDRDVPVFRDAPPADAKRFGLYEIGASGFGDTVFVIGTFEDARAAEAAAAKGPQWQRNTRLLGIGAEGKGGG